MSWIFDITPLSRRDRISVKEDKPRERLPRLLKETSQEEINELKQLKIKLRAMIDGDIEGPFSDYESRRKYQLEKKYKYHQDYLMW